MREKDLLKLELPKILNRIKEYSSSPATKEYIDTLRPHRQELKVREEVEDTRTLLNLLRSGLKLPIGEFEDIRAHLRRSKIEGAWLSAKELHEVLKVVTTLRVVKDYLKRISKEHPNLQKYAERIASFKEIER
jgi:dsDNA-specific endonuclease/ATPase MutS2